MGRVQERYRKNVIVQPPTCPPPAGGRDWVRGHPARPDASETLAYPGIARTDSVNAYKYRERLRKNRPMNN
jgi:hypothetical protein